MYSVVLMAALTAGNAAPDCHRHGCCGCYGGYGCGGCYGGCYGGGCYGGGCYGGCYGGFGGCGGGCWGGGYGGCYGCWGGYSSWGCMGCMGSYGGAGYGMGGGYAAPMMGGGMMAPGGTGTAPQGEGVGMPKENKKSTMLDSSKAKLVVSLPTDAKLFIDDLPMKTTSNVRSFNTPTLEPGQAYYYVVRVETVREGKPVAESRRVIVRAGETARADFTDLQVDAVRTVKAK